MEVDILILKPRQFPVSPISMLKKIKNMFETEQFARAVQERQVT